ncbi:C6 transcription factor [Penicillium malachiteum]|uniref:C6 transcription factor n=1 Tax=Penicillium malachiteum TaxID=1324776 RepID=A0AAD6MWU7_9EURO|nr:C6 transcription factor [Penicillium malachiteum]
MDVRRYNVERSCLRCHERKVGCDKGNPCSKCMRLNVPCQYPGPKRVKRRAPKSSTTDMTARLEQLERSIATLAGQAQSPQPSHSSTQDVERASVTDTGPSTSAVQIRRSSTAVSTAHHGFLAKNGSYVDDPLLSRVLEKEDDLQSAMGSPNTHKNAAMKPMPMKLDGIITNPQLIQLDLQVLLPSRWQATQLWETFLSRVDPVVKCIHIPTVKPRIFAAISRPDSVPPDVHCLLFAIFFGAATTMASDDPGNEKIRADLRRYQQGIELAMYQSSFLDSPTVKSLQAMAIYLTCLRCNNSSRSGFTLRGLAIRAAQSIGLHRDGKHFKLPPLECEIRRRLWWILYTTDARMAEDHGITIAEQGYRSDTELPANIDDQNLLKTATEPIESQPHWTEMSFQLIIAEVNKSWYEVAQATAKTHEPSDPEQLLAQLKTTLYEKYTQHGDLDIPIQRMGMMLADVLVAKREVHLRQKLLHAQGANSAAVGSTEATRELLRMASNALNLGLRMYQDELLHGFRWLSSTYTQFHLLTYILWHLCVHPTDPYVDEAWHNVNMHFELVEHDPSWPDPGAKWPMLVQLRAKALRIRNAHVQPVQSVTATGIEHREGPSVGFVDDAIQGLEIPLDIEDFDLSWSEFFPDWNYMAESISFMGQEG